MILCFLVPEQPSFLKVIKVDKDTATLSWGLPKKLNGNLTGYLLQYQISKYRIELDLIYQRFNFCLRNWVATQWALFPIVQGTVQ